MNEILPWHQQSWDEFTSNADRLHHGLLLNGLSGIGRREFAMQLSGYLLCDAADSSKPCGKCQSCTLFRAGTHPDFHMLTTELEAESGRIDLIKQFSGRYQDVAAREKKANPAKIIPVDQIRLLIDRFYRSAHISENKVALILPADRMNGNAANALLKLLEEPPENSYLILVTNYPEHLPPTVRSRCILERLPAPDEAAARLWLRERVDSSGLLDDLGQSYGPLDVLARLSTGEAELERNNNNMLLQLLVGNSDPVELAAHLTKQKNIAVFVWLHEWISALIKWHATDVMPPWLNRSIGESLIQNRQFAPASLHGLYDKIGKYRYMAQDQLNIQLALEEVLISLRRL